MAESKSPKKTRANSEVASETEVKKSAAPKTAERKKTGSEVSKSGKYFYATGKRKTSIARVRLYKGTGNFIVNGLPLEDYFKLKTAIETIKAPLKKANSLDKFDVSIFVEGGGTVSQADAIRHGISRSLVESDPTNRPVLKQEKFLTRDSRIKERKKPGKKRARKGPQFSKR